MVTPAATEPIRIARRVSIGVSPRSAVSKKSYCAGVASLSRGKAMEFLPEIDVAHFDAGLSIASRVTSYRSVRSTV
jgi:hypothetical protein